MDLPKKGEGELSTIDGDPVVEAGGINEEGMYLSIYIYIYVLFRIE